MATHIQLRDLGALRWLHAGESVILYGPVGGGKSHIAQSLGQLVIRQGRDVRFIKTSRALATWQAVMPTRPGTSTWPN